MIDVHSEEYILGQNIKKYRTLKKWTQSKLSEAVDIDRAEISKYESGQNGEIPDGYLPALMGGAVCQKYTQFCLHPARSGG